MSLFNFGANKKGGRPARAGLPADLQDEASRFKVIINTIEDGVILIDNQQTIQLINPAAAALCGWKAEDATGINVGQVLKLATNKSEPLADSDNPLKKVLQDGQSSHYDTILMTPSNQQVSINLRMTPLMGDDQQVTAAVAVFSNVSAERAEEKQRADFISTASHEMRTPVAAIEGYLALALNDKVATIDTRARDYLEKAHSSTQHLGKLFQDLLTSAKAEDGRLTSHPAVVEMGEFLEQLTGDFHLIAEKKGLFMEFTVGGANATINATQPEGGGKVIKPLYYVYADPDRLREVITNLFDNAVKYTPEGKITIGLTGNDRVVQMYVRDTGPGIPAEDLPHLFQKFYRVDNSATRTIGGTGLGLFICRKIVELYNGRIWAESKVNEGSNFYINLPRLTTQKAIELQNTDGGATSSGPIISNA
ncbi:MAG TPA: ATP-binding protein [Candidatus Saccharimonadales bacterium]|jgi:PAS domain S-box-containing protein|nr:ATP-binding protein [Candidatus Saccharimonadales bacterium]